MRMFISVCMWEMEGLLLDVELSVNLDFLLSTERQASSSCRNGLDEAIFKKTQLPDCESLWKHPDPFHFEAEVETLLW